ncbi:MAG: DUF4349 domain-containing protein [Actinomycetes bacterium]
MRGTRTTAAAISVAMLAGSALLLTACSSDSNDGSSTADQASTDGPAAAAPKPMNGALDGVGALADSRDAAGSTAAEGSIDNSGGDLTASQTSQGGGNLADVTVERKVIATAEMTLRSDDVTATVDNIESIAKAANGYVSGRDVQNNPDDPDRTRATIVVRVPTSKLDTVIDDAQAEGDVVHVVSDEQDVTQTVVDVNSRVDSARASVDRIRVLLAQANTIGEVVRIEGELSRREADLESLLAQQRALADQTSMATLSVTVLAPEAVEAAPKADPQDDEGFVAGLERGWNALVDVVVVALTTVGLLLPFLAVGAIVVIPILIAWKNRRRDGTPKGPQPEPA